MPTMMFSHKVFISNITMLCTVIYPPQIPLSTPNLNYLPSPSLAKPPNPLAVNPYLVYNMHEKHMKINAKSLPQERMTLMNETMKAILERYSCRDFSPDPLTDAQVQALVQAALAAPSAMNRQPWHIIVVTDKALIEELDADAMSILKAQNSEMYQRMAERGGKLFYNAPCLIVIANDATDAATLDSGIVSQNIALAAHSMGLGNVICGMARIPLAGPRGQEWTKRLQIPEGYSFGMSVCVGKAQSGKAPHELDLTKVTYI